MKIIASLDGIRGNESSLSIGTPNIVEERTRSDLRCAEADQGQWPERKRNTFPAIIKSEMAFLWPWPHNFYSTIHLMNY